ncbi:WecB/TagA/CpsF family glycosyltransferase [Enterococcus sp. C76]|uniref:WecB/TagA/CpsF family glycosyltransferase n=1 Tax=Enterococcus sp. C76 TaxID=3231334 RepID=UPI0034A03948
MKQTIFDIDVYNLKMKDFVELIESKIYCSEPTHVLGINAEKIVDIKKNKKLKRIVNSADIVHADGVSVVLASVILKKVIKERVAGIDLMVELLKLSEEKNFTVYFLGASEYVLNKLEEKIRKKYPNLKIKGFRNGYFTKKEWEEIGSELKKIRPQLVFVGITSPKKEYVIDYFINKGVNSVFMGVGGSFDVLSGEIKRAPYYMQKCNLEWLFRLIQEPRRLIKRYFIGNMKFIYFTFEEKLKQVRGQDE